VSAIGEDGCTSQIIFHSNAREWEVPKEWREKELKDGEFRYNPESIIQKKGKYIMTLDLKEGYLGYKIPENKNKEMGINFSHGGM